MRKNYVTVTLPRSGLGHALESYSRAFLYYASGVAEFIHPNWFKIRTGPYLRREMDKRNYWRIIQTPRTWGLPPIHSVRKFFLKTVTEATFDPTAEGQFLTVVDEGPHSYLRLNPYKAEFVAALESMSRLPLRPKFATPSIGIFHRSGDFLGLQPKSAVDERARRTIGYGYLPPGYAADALRKCRAVAGWQVPAVLSTDADSQEVACILDQGKVTLARTDSSFANMLEMRHHDVLIVGTSSYGHWCYFLGDAFGIFPMASNTEIDNFQPLGIPEREGAQFIFADETSLNDTLIAGLLARRLVRP